MFSLIGYNLQSQGLRDFRQLAPQSGAVQAFSRMEFGLELDTVFTNPADKYAYEGVYALFTRPNGDTLRVYPFYYREFEDLSGLAPPQEIVRGSEPSYLDACRGGDISPALRWAPVEAPYPWRLRFRPDMPGAWRMQLMGRRGTRQVPILGELNFFCIDNKRPGYLALGEQYLKDSRERPVMLIGENLSYWIAPGFSYTGQATDYPPQTRCQYLHWLEELRAAGGNFARIIMAPWTFDLEWIEPGNYDAYLNRAADLDSIFSWCEQHGVYLLLSVFDHAAMNIRMEDAFVGQYCWPANPLSREPGLRDWANFWTDPGAKALARQKIRYVFSRWGDSPYFMGIELNSEADKFYPTDQPFLRERRNIVNWHGEMSAYAKSLCPRMLLSTGVAHNKNGEVFWPLPDIDFANNHEYSNAKNHNHRLSYMTQRSRQLSGKPFLMGEYGSYAFPCSQGDALMVTLHNGLWVSALSGAFAPALNWWTDQMHAYWHQPRGLAHIAPLKAFLDQELLRGVWKPLGNPCNGTFLPAFEKNDGCHTDGRRPVPDFQLSGIASSDDDHVAAFALQQNERILGWVHNKNHYWFALPHTSTRSGSTLDPITGCEAFNWPEKGGTTPPAGENPLTQGRENDWLRFGGLRPGARYRVEWWHAWPLYDYNSDGRPQGGEGRIEALTSTVSVAANGVLEIKIPRLIGVSAESALLRSNWEAPDYGFKLIPIP